MDNVEIWRNLEKNAAQTVIFLPPYMRRKKLNNDMMVLWWLIRCLSDAVYS